MSLKFFSRLVVLFSIVPSIYFSFFPGEIVGITILMCYPLLAGIILYVSQNHFLDLDSKKLIMIFIIYSIIIFFRGIIGASNYQDWTTLASRGVALTLFLPFTIFLGAKMKSIVEMFRSFLMYVPLIFILFFTTTDPGPYGFVKTLSPIVIFLFLLPYLNKKIQLVVICIVLISFFRDITIRSNMLNIVVATSILGTYFFKEKKWMHGLIKTIAPVALFMPLLFSLLAFNGVINVFQIGESVDYVVKDDTGRSQEVFVDSRTEIYLDVINELSYQNAVIWGLGASGKTDTFLTNIPNSSYQDIYREGRRSTEAGMLNYLQYGGLFGGLLYFLLFMTSSLLSIYRSKNWFSVMVGLWVAFKAIMSFITDPLPFTVSSIFIFLLIGMGFNKQLRSFNDQYLKDYFSRHVNKFYPLSLSSFLTKN